MERRSLPLQVINYNAAGIDVGFRTHLVAVDQNKENVRSFGIYTKDHELLITHLQNHGITSVAMKYRELLANPLQCVTKAGFVVVLGGGSQTKNVQGRKTDVIDCIWIQNRSAEATSLIGSIIW